MRFDKYFDAGKLNEKGRTNCKRIFLKEALGGELSSDENAFLHLLTVNQYDEVCNELCSEETSFLDIYCMLRDILTEAFDYSNALPKEDSNFSEDDYYSRIDHYMNMREQANILLLNRTMKPLNIENLVGTKEMVYKATQKGMVLCELPFPFFGTKGRKTN